ncbi:dihydroorotase [Anaerolentibacter hominis]|uniref:dihydroorotase n=1 Tax=Anaerolentibacter hominis TaxID=3079009 RepID=UPI0031B84378
MQRRTLIQNGHVIDPASGRDGIYDVLVVGDKIEKVSEQISEQADEIVDAKGCLVMPGFVDLHVHLREPGLEYKETIATGTQAAARGGFTTICPMANTKPPIDSPEMVRLLREKIETDGLVHVLIVGAVTKGLDGTEVCDIPGMAAEGMKAISEDGKSVMNSAVYARAMKLAKEHQVVVLAHCEDINLVRGGVMHEGKRSKELGLPGITSAVEDIITARDIALAKETGARLHLCHCSTKASVTMVRLAKEAGVSVSAEICPHHFTLCDEDIPRDDGNYKMNPPLRGREDLEALRTGLKDGTMEVIATDHAPHAQEEKECSMRQAAFGIVGLETAFALGYTELVEKGVLSLSQLVEKMSLNPSRIIGIEKGSLEEGRTADLVIADVSEPYCIDTNTFASKGKNTPFNGRRVKGRIRMTMVDGTIVYRDQV